jgi:stage V sporulation protein D (sporulation-specific penicillin-binding protein)
MRRSMVFRIRLITGCILLLSLILIGRLYVVQVMQGDRYEARAEGQYVETRQSVYARGGIYFTTRDGKEVAAASVRSGYLLAFNPSLITDGAATCAALQPFLTITTERCLEQATLEKRTYVEVERTLPKEVYAPISELKLPGVQLYRNQWRFYPGDSLAARMIGFVGFTEKSETELHGKYGLERQYDSLLLKEREVRSVNIFAEIFSNLGDMVYQKDESVHGDIVTTIEPTVARMLDEVLMDTNDAYKSNLTGAIIMNPKTGAIYAMSAVPTFDLNNRGEASIEEFRNPLVENVYEFGSTIKALTMAAGIDSGVVSRHATYYDGGSITLDGYTIRNFDGKGRGTVEMQQVLSQSLNTGVSYIVQKMGKDAFRDYFLNFKLGSETGIDLPNEAFGLTDNLRSPRDVEYATASFGQGIALTPIAATRALAVLGNGGYLVTPHVVSKIRYEDGTERELQYPKGAQVLKSETSEEISGMLTTVVDTALRGGSVALPHHTIGAKTGTAQIADTVNGGYYEDKFLHSFFGYFPAFDPEFLVFMYTVEPKGVQYASETLTLPFMEIAKFLINYYDIPPDR